MPPSDPIKELSAAETAAVDTTDATTAVLRRDILSFEGFNTPWYKQLLFIALGVCTGGLLFLVAKWSLRVRIALRLRWCRLKDAQFVLTTVSFADLQLFGI